MQNIEMADQLQEYLGALNATTTTFICSRHGDQCHLHYLCQELISASRIPTPRWAQCALTGKVMKKPVMDDLGRSYEREIYARQGGEGGQMRPYGKMEGSFQAYPNLHLELAIRDYWHKCLAEFQ